MDLEKHVDEDSVDWTRIVFPHPLRVGKTEFLLRYLSNALPANIDYIINTRVELKGIQYRSGVIESTQRASHVTMVRVLQMGNSPPDDLSFRPKMVFIADGRGGLVECVSGLDFESIPGYKQSEHRKEVVHTVDALRAGILSYFETQHTPRTLPKKI